MIDRWHCLLLSHSTIWKMVSKSRTPLKKKKLFFGRFQGSLITFVTRQGGCEPRGYEAIQNNKEKAKAPVRKHDEKINGENWE